VRAVVAAAGFGVGFGVVLAPVGEELRQLVGQPLTQLVTERDIVRTVGEVHRRKLP
jgi:predicted cation transporter